jgi:F-type H+-transporting ATPase subunit delta
MSLVANKYAVALFEIAVEKDSIENIYEEFQTVNTILMDEKNFMELMLVPSIESAKKKKIIENVFKKDLNKYLDNFLNILIDKNRIEYIHEIFDVFKKKYFAYKDMVEATVVTVIPLKEELLEALKAKLEKRFNKKVLLKNKVDEAILGGAVVYIGEQVIDGSVYKQINELKSNMNNIRLY